MRFTRQMVRYYLRSDANRADFTAKSTIMVRLLFEEAWHRTLLSVEDRVLQAAYCSVMMTMREFEDSTLLQHASTWGYFWTFNEASMRPIATKIGRRLDTSVEDMPSWNEVAKMPEFALEAASLRTPTVVPGALALSKKEIEALLLAIPKAKPLTDEEHENNPGHDGPSKFLNCFPKKKASEGKKEDL